VFTNTCVSPIVSDFVTICRSIRIHTKSTAFFTRGMPVDDNETICQSTFGYFGTLPEGVVEGIPLNFDEWCSRLSQQVDMFTSRGSGFTLEQIQDFTLIITRYLPFTGSSSSFIETPEWLHAKRCVINVRNDDQKCFVWSVLACLLYDKCNVNPGRMTQYRQYLYVLNLEGLEFPMP
jgi:hypothetical protein